MSKFTSDQKRRIKSALVESHDRLDVLNTRKTFDEFQENERIDEIAFLESHVQKLNSWMAQ